MSFKSKSGLSKITSFFPGSQVDHYSLSLAGPWDKSLNFIVPTKHVIPESLKFSHWLSEIKRIVPWNCCLQTLTKRYHAPTRLPHKAHLRIGTFTDGRYYMFSRARRAICGVGWVGGVLEPQTEHCGFRRPLPRLVMFDLKLNTNTFFW